MYKYNKNDNMIKELVWSLKKLGFESWLLRLDFESYGLGYPYVIYIRIQNSYINLFYIPHHFHHKYKKPHLNTTM